MVQMLSVPKRSFSMFQQFKYYALDLIQEWLSRFLTLEMIVFVMIILRLMKYFYFSSMTMSNQWHQTKTTSYQVLEYVWHHEISSLVMILPLAMLMDVFLKRMFPEKFAWGQKKTNQESK